MPNAARRNMHGFVSLVVAVSFAYIILLLVAYYMEMRSTALKTDEELMLIKNHNARELEAKRMVSNTIDHSIQNIPPDMDSENASRYVASQLALLEGKEDSSYNTNHLRINFWCGFISSDEAMSMKAEMIERRQIVICPRPGCWDMDEYILYPSQRCLEEAYAEGNPSECLVPACMPFLSYDRINKRITISSPPEMYSMEFLGEPAIGVSVLDTVNNISSVMIMPIGTTIPEPYN